MDIKQQQDTAERIEFTISNLQHHLDKLYKIDNPSTHIVDGRVYLSTAIQQLKKELTSNGTA